MKLCIAACLAIAASGCAQRPLSLSYDVLIDPSFTPAQLEQATLAPGAWSAAVPGITLRVAVGACVGEKALCIVPAFGAQHLAGWTSEDPNGGAVSYVSVDEIARRAPDAATALAWIEWTAEHELGHGLTNGDHLADRTRMATYLQLESSDITPADVAHFWAVR